MEREKERREERGKRRNEMRQEDGGLSIEDSDNKASELIWGKVVRLWCCFDRCVYDAVKIRVSASAGAGDFSVSVPLRPTS